MPPLVAKLKNSTLIRYIFVGGVSFIVELAILFGLLGLGNTRQIATGIAYWFGLILAFLLQKFVAFQDARREVKILTKQGVLFAVLTTWNWVFTIGVVSLFPSEWLLFSRILAQAIFVCWNFVIYKKVIFKQDKA